MNTNQEETNTEVVEEEVLCCCFEIMGDNDQCQIHGKNKQSDS